MQMVTIFCTGCLGSLPPFLLIPFRIAAVGQQEADIHLRGTCCNLRLPCQNVTCKDESQYMLSVSLGMGCWS